MQRALHIFVIVKPSPLWHVVRGGGRELWTLQLLLPQNQWVIRPLLFVWNAYRITYCLWVCSVKPFIMLHNLGYKKHSLCRS